MELESAIQNIQELATLVLQAQQTGNLAHTEAILDEAIQQDAQNAQLWLIRARVHRTQEKLALAEAGYRQTVRLKPNLSTAYAELGEIFQIAGQKNKSEAMFLCALSHTPTHEQAQHHLLKLYVEQGRCEEARIHLNQIKNKESNAVWIARALEIIDDEGLLGLFEFLDLDQSKDAPQRFFLRLEENEDALRQLIAQNPDYAQAYNNLGVVLSWQGRLEEAEQCLRKALALKPNYPGAHWMLGTVLLAAGNFKSGWTEYEWRFAANPMLRRDFGGPIWQGQNLQGCTILLTHEQGLGDTLQFVRYATVIARMAARVLLLVPPELKRLVQTVSGVAEVFCDSDRLPVFDFSCPLLSVPAYLHTDVNSIPNNVPYLVSHLHATEQWAAHLAKDSQS